MKLSVNVTQDHIARGKRGNSESCPVALAIRELLPEGSYVAVDEDRIYVESRTWVAGTYVKADASDEVVEFEHLFDSGEPVEPFSFEVDLS